MDAVLRQLRAINAAFLLSAVLYVAIAEQIRHGEESLSSEFYWPVAILSFTCALGALLIKNRLAGPAETGLRVQPEDSALLTRWRMGHIVAFAFAESAILFGFVLRVMGGTPAEAGMVCASGIAALLLIAPRRP